MKIIDLLKEEALLIESGIRIPKGTKAVKILYHDDMDGLGSAKSYADQLIRQGISKKNITYYPISDSTSKEEEERLLQKKNSQIIVALDFDRFNNRELAKKQVDIFSDHHDQPPGQETISKSGGSTGKTQFSSETEHIQQSYKSSGQDPAVQQFSQIDKADFGEDFLTNINMEKAPKSKEGQRMRRLAIITNSMISQIVRSKRNKNAADVLLEKSTMSIVNWHNLAKKLITLNNLQIKAIKELNKKNPDMDLVNKIRNQVEKEGSKKMAEDIAKENPAKLKPMVLPDQMRKKGEKDLIAMQKELSDPESSKISQKGYVIIQDITGSSQPGRYTNFFLESDTPINAQLRQWATFIQMSISPKTPKEIREKIDLGEVKNEVLKEIRKMFETKYNKWAFDIVERESGGHKGITNISGLGTIGLMPKKLRTRLKELENSEKYKKYKKLPKKSKERLSQLPGFQRLEKEIEELREKKKEYAKERKQIIEAIKNKMIEIVNEKIEEAYL